MVTEGFKRLLTKWSSWRPDDGDRKEESATTQPEQRQFRYAHPMKPLLRVGRKVFLQLGFLLLRLVTSCVLWLYYLCNGTFVKSFRSRRPENYGYSARVYEILAKYKYDELVNKNSLGDFVIKHACFDHPRRVLAPEVSLYDINETEAVFVEAPPGVEVWRSRHDAFLNIAQLKHAVRAIVMPIESFYRLADEVGDPAGRLVFITNTARCGSTLLNRVFEETDEFVTYGEPTVVNYLRKFVGRESEPWVQHHTRAIIRVLCKPAGDIENYVIKITPTATTVVPLLQKVYPNASQLFIYRDGLPCATSMYKIWLQLPMGYVNVMFARHFHWAYVKVLNWANYYDTLDNDKEKLVLTPGYGQGCFYWGNVINMYRNYRKNGFHIAAVKYEDLVGDPETTVTRMFDYCAISRALVKPGLRAFKSDSQKNSFLSMRQLRQYKLPEFTEEVQRETDRICDYFRLARLGTSCVLEGTLTRELLECPVRA